MKKKKKSAFAVTLLTIFSLLGMVVLIAVGYLSYVTVSYYRIGDITLEVLNNRSDMIKADDIGHKEFTITTYNIGFGAYDRDYSFFMDASEFKEEYVESQGQKETSGKQARGNSALAVMKNTNGAYQTIRGISNVDFMLYQEVDTKSQRAHNINQLELGDAHHSNYGRVYAVNYHSAFLAYPFHEPIGASNSGITTYSKYKIDNAQRKEFTITDSFFGKFFDLDRAFSITTLPIENSTKKLYIFNIHMSAYDEAGVIRKLQLAQLKEAIHAARDFEGEDNYVLVGGDFNHDLVIDNPHADNHYKDTIFNKQETDILNTDWYNYLRLDESKDGTTAKDLITEEDVTYEYDFKDLRLNAYGPTNIGTCRDASIPFQDKNNNGIVDNAMVTIDGFLASDNIEVTHIETIGSGEGLQEENLPLDDPRYGLGFVYSDHNPVLMNFKLLG